MTQEKHQISALFLILATLFTTGLMAANLFATKQISFGPVNFTGAIFVFPITYIVNDVVSEVYGFNRAKTLIWMAFALNFAFVIIGWLIDLIPGAVWWQETPAGIGFHAIFGLAPRIVFASFLAFLVGSFMNAFVMSKMKVRDNGKRFTLRAIMSSLLGEACDSVIFFPVALLGIVPLDQMPSFVLWQVGLKTAYEIIILPVTVRVVKWVKKHEDIDVFDTNISYNIFKK